MMKGKRDPRSNLYMLNLTQRNKLMTDLPTPDKYFAGSVYVCKSKGTLVGYHHTSCWSPTQSGWVRAITKKFFTSWPGLSYDLVHKYLTKKINHTWARTTINTEKINLIITRSRTWTRTIPISSIHAVRRNQSYIHQDSGFDRENLNGLNRKVPSYIQQGQQVYTGSIPLWLQHYSCRTFKHTKMTWFEYRVPKTPHTIDQQRFET